MPEKPAQPTDAEEAPLPEQPAPTDQAATDTSTDWDEWMERHGGKPAPVPDVADGEGRFKE